MSIASICRTFATLTLCTATASCSSRLLLSHFDPPTQVSYRPHCAPSGYLPNADLTIAAIAGAITVAVTTWAVAREQDSSRNEDIGPIVFAAFSAPVTGVFAVSGLGGTLLTRQCRSRWEAHNDWMHARPEEASKALEEEPQSPPSMLRRY